MNDPRKLDIEGDAMRSRVLENIRQMMVDGAEVFAESGTYEFAGADGWMVERPNGSRTITIRTPPVPITEAEAARAFAAEAIFDDGPDRDETSQAWRDGLLDAKNGQIEPEDERHRGRAARHLWEKGQRAWCSISDEGN